MCMSVCFDGRMKASNMAIFIGVSGALQVAYVVTKYIAVSKLLLFRVFRR
jgi:hypothetical protein